LIDCLTQDGETALSIARQVGFESVVQYLTPLTRADGLTVAAPGEREYNAQCPETMSERIDSDDEFGAGRCGLLSV